MRWILLAAVPAALFIASRLRLTSDPFRFFGIEKARDTKSIAAKMILHCVVYWTEALLCHLITHYVRFNNKEYQPMHQFY